MKDGLTRREALLLIGAAAVIGGEPGGLKAAATQGRRTGMLTKAIPSSKEMLPVIGLGTWQTFDVGTAAVARQPLEGVLRAFVAAGGRVIDSSPMYGSSESVVGDLAAKLGLHDDLFVATKVWTSGRRSGVDQMNDSMRKLRAKRIDLMQVHNLVDVATHLDTLDEWKREGRIRYVGITHYHSGAYAEVEKVFASRRGIDFLQINYSVAEREAERRILPLARERGVAVLINRPFASGELFRRLRSRPLPAFASEIGCTSWAQLLLKFVVSHPAVTCAIPATSKAAHVEDNMRAGVGVMPDERIRALIANAL